MKREIEGPAVLVVKMLKEWNLTLAAAESCTGGLLSVCITDVPGASGVFWGAFVTYTAGAKEALGVPAELLKSYGAVSREAALAMAECALRESGASFALSVTGIAGPDGDGSGTPPGTVWVGIAGRQRDTDLPEAAVYHFEGGRAAVRESAVRAALEMLICRLRQAGPGPAPGALPAGEEGAIPLPLAAADDSVITESGDYAAGLRAEEAE